ncbi:MAG: TetR family transcriptional regulator [Hyphomonadaceae bacterium]|nr:TetR family transcriptional regulator [Hyphomonadaceae bacterium]
MDRPASNTRLAIVAAFNRLVLSTRRARPPVAHLLREAGVARSTLYSHFDDRDALLLEAMKGPLSVLADALMSEGHDERLVGLLEHFWQQRRGALDVLQGKFATRLVRVLADLIMARDATLERNDAIRLADSQIGFIRLWVSGETPGTSEALAAKMVASAHAYRAMLRE